MAQSPSSRGLDLGLLVLRLGFGLGFFWFHGWPKLIGGRERWEGVGGSMGSLGIDFGAWGWGLAAALAESGGALLFASGLFFRPMAVVLGFVMVVATANHIVTEQGTISHSFKNIWVFLGMAIAGPGRYSLDAWLAERRKGRR
jgi:putative oxidoreductase